MSEELPTEDECWDNFWAVIARMTVDAHRRGETPDEESAA